MSFQLSKVLGLEKATRFFFIFIMSYKYFFPSSAWRRIIATWNTLYLATSPLSPNTGNANLDSYLYHPCLASLLCLGFVFGV